MAKHKSATAPKVADKTESKTETVIALLKRKDGASLAEITGATGWQPHSARAVLTGFRKKGHTIGRAKVDGVTHWSIGADATQ